MVIFKTITHHPFETARAHYSKKKSEYTHVRQLKTKSQQQTRDTPGADVHSTLRRFECCPRAECSRATAGRRNKTGRTRRTESACSRTGTTRRTEPRRRRGAAETSLLPYTRRCPPAALASVLFVRILSGDEPLFNED